MRTRFRHAVLLVGLVGLLAPATAVQATADPVESAVPPASSFVVAESAVRVLDTRTGGRPPVPGNGTVTVDLSTKVPSGTTAVVLNVTAISMSRETYVTAWEAGTPRPATSSINLRANEVRSNSVTVPVGPDRRVSLYTHNSPTHLVADLAGHYATTEASWYNSVTPQQFLDTRRTDDPFRAATARTVSLAGRVPAGTTAAVVNLTAVAPTQDTFLSITRTITGRPATSSLNARRGETTPNLVTVPVSQDLTIAVWNNAGTVDVFADLIGYYSPDEGAAFFPMAPVRAYDSRPDSMNPGTERRVAVDLVAPADATALLFNLTGIAYWDSTYVTVWQAGQHRPGTSTLNLKVPQVAANHAVVPLGPEAAVDVYTHSGILDFIIDVSGYFAPRAG